jgi:hypothetical protein
MKISELAALAAAAMLLGLTACVGDGDGKAWQEFQMYGADFAVSVPKMPLVNEDITAKDGNVSRNYVVEADEITYTVVYKTSTSNAKKPTSLDGWLDKLAKDIAANMKGTLRDEHRLTLDDAHGDDVQSMEFVLDVPASGNKAAHSITGRIYVKHAKSGKILKDVLYETLVTADPGHDRAASVTRFLDSFHFVAS